MNVRLVTLNGSAGAYTPVYATSVTRRVEIIEDGSANSGVSQGIIYQIDDGSTTPFTTVYTREPQTELIVLGEVIAFGTGYGRVVGTPPDNSGGYSIPATLLGNFKSATTTGTVIRVTEFA